MSDEIFRQENPAGNQQGPQMFFGNMSPGMRAALEQQRGEAEQQIKSGNKDIPAAPAEFMPQPVAAPFMQAETLKSMPAPRQIQEFSRGIPNNPALHAVLARIDNSNYHTVQLPSMGRFYDSPINNGVLHVREMTGAEEEILATPQHVRSNEAMDMIFSKCIQEKINTRKLLTVDRSYLMIFLRGVSISSNYEVEITCPITNRQFAHTINLSELPVETCPPNFDVSTLQGTLPKSGLKFRYRLSTGEDEKVIEDHRQRRLKMFSGNASDDTLTFQTAWLTEQIEDLTSKEEIQEIIKRLPLEDVSHLRSAVNDPPFGVDLNISIFSPYSGEEFTQRLPLEASFFFPSFKRKTGP